MFAALGCGLKPRHNQEEWVQSIWTKWERLRDQCNEPLVADLDEEVCHDSTLPCMAVSAMTGAGKTALNVVFAWHCLIKQHASKVIYCVHTKNLLKQAYDTWDQSPLTVAVLFGKGSYIDEQRVKLFFRQPRVEVKDKYKADVETIRTAIDRARKAEDWEDPSALFASSMGTNDPSLEPSDIKKLFGQVCCDDDSPTDPEISGFSVAKKRCARADVVLMTYAAWFTYETVFEPDGVCRKIWLDVEPHHVLCVLDEGDQARTAFAGVMETLRSISWRGFSASQVAAANHLKVYIDHYNNVLPKFAVADKGKLTFPEPRDHNASISMNHRKNIQDILDHPLNWPSNTDDLQAAKQLYHTCTGTLQRLFGAAQENYDLDCIGDRTLVDIWGNGNQKQVGSKLRDMAAKAMAGKARQDNYAGTYACILLAQQPDISVTRAERIAGEWGVKDEVGRRIQDLRESAVRCAKLNLDTCTGVISWHSVECVHKVYHIPETLELLRTAFDCSSATATWRDAQWRMLVPSIQVDPEDSERVEFRAVPSYALIQDQLRDVWNRGWAGVIFTSATLHDCKQPILTRSFQDFWKEVNMVEARACRDQIRFEPVFECTNMRVVSTSHYSFKKTHNTWGQHFQKNRQNEMKPTAQIQAMHDHEADVIENEIIRAGAGAKVLIVGPSFSRIQAMRHSLVERLPEFIDNQKVQFIDHRKDKVLKGIVNGSKPRGDRYESRAVQIVFGSKGVATGLDLRWDIVVLLQRINSAYPRLQLWYETGNTTVQEEIRQLWNVEADRESRQACGRLMRNAQSRGTLIVLDPMPRTWFLTNPTKDQRKKAMVLFPGCTHETALVEPSRCGKRRCV